MLLRDHIYLLREFTIFLPNFSPLKVTTPIGLLWCKPWVE